jgi:predicted N-acetyltransferase YhbS
MLIRPEQPEDIPSIRRVHRAAFESAVEADIVDALRMRFGFSTASGGGL